MSKDKAPMGFDDDDLERFLVLLDQRQLSQATVRSLVWQFKKQKAKLAECVAALEAADFVLQGSRAIPGQSDKTLDKREGALGFFLDTLAKVKK